MSTSCYKKNKKSIFIEMNYNFFNLLPYFLKYSNHLYNKGICSN